MASRSSSSSLLEALEALDIIALTNACLATAGVVAKVTSLEEALTVCSR